MLIDECKQMDIYEKIDKQVNILYRILDYQYFLSHLEIVKDFKRFTFYFKLIDDWRNIRQEKY